MDNVNVNQEIHKAVKNIFLGLGFQSCYRSERLLEETSNEANPPSSWGWDVVALNPLIPSLGGARPAWFRAKLAVLVAIVAGGVGLINSGTYSLTIAGEVVLGLMVVHALQLLHQCVHETAFYDKFWNRAIGTILGLPLLISFSDHQAKHVDHHRLLGTAASREVIILATPWDVLRYFSLWPHYRQTARNAAKSLIALSGFGHRLPARLRPSVEMTREYAIIMVFVAALCAVAVISSRLVLIYWLVPVAIATPIHAGLDLVAHWRCQHVGTAFLTTRNVEAGFIGRWFTNGNNFHVEHHLWPQLAPEALYRAHEYCRDEIAHRETSYLAFVMQLLFGA